MMFTRFHNHYGSGTHDLGKQDAELLAKLEPYAAGISQLLSDSGGSSFSRGLYRLHASGNIPAWTENVAEAFPQYRNKIICFGYDWLGRHFALDTRNQSDQWSILLIEPGTGEALEIPASFADFHNIEAVEYASDALAQPFFDKWISSGGVPPGIMQCIGYKIPLFLGGSDTIDNLELSDMDVYWHLCGQLLQARPKG